MSFRTILCLCLSWILSACAVVQPAPEPEQPADRFIRFPEGFIWGTATAAYQVEGGIRNNWSAAGIDAGLAVDHYNRYDEDFAQAQKLGISAYRMSIEWASIEPERGQYNREAIEHYREMFKSMRSHGLRPMVTLFHFTTPIWFEKRGGFGKRENMADFVRFVRYVTKQFKHEVDWWNTVNEPLVYAFKSFDEGSWPPFRHNRNEALRVAANLMIAHGKAYRAIHELDPIAWVGYAHNTTLLQPLTPWNPLEQLMTDVQSYLFNEAFWDTILKGEMNFSAPGLDPVVVKYDPDLKGSMDFIGINYYTRYLVTSTGATTTLPNVPVTDLNWEIYPQGLLQVLRLAKPYAEALRIPIMITENGLADRSDKQRGKFLVDHLAQIRLAIDEGIPVRGYFHWSLMDNFEWVEGFEAQFGLLDSERNWRPSAYLYQKIAMANGFPALWLKQLPKLETN